MATHPKTRSSAEFPRRAFLGILAVLLALAIPSRAIAQARKIELGDLQKIVSVSSPEISPDGKSIVIVVSRVNWDEDRSDSRLVLVDIATGAQRPLTNIRKGLILPKWSPSGDRLAFLAEAGEDRKPPRKSLCCPLTVARRNRSLALLWALNSLPGVRTAPSSPLPRPTNRQIKRRSKNTMTCLEWATTVTSLPPLPLLRTSGWSRLRRQGEAPHFRRVEPVEDRGGFSTLLAAFLVAGQQADLLHSAGRRALWRQRSNRRRDTGRWHRANPPSDETHRI